MAAVWYWDKGIQSLCAYIPHPWCQQMQKSTFATDPPSLKKSFSLLTGDNPATEDILSRYESLKRRQKINCTPLSYKRRRGPTRTSLFCQYPFLHDLRTCICIADVPKVKLEGKEWKSQDSRFSREAKIMATKTWPSTRLWNCHSSVRYETKKCKRKCTNVLPGCQCVGKRTATNKESKARTTDLPLPCIFKVR